MTWKNKTVPQVEPGDDVRDQNIDPGTVPAVNWDGSNKGTVALLGSNRDPEQVA